MLICEICQYFFCWKNVRSFCIAKASLNFSTKKFCVFGYKVVKHLTSWPLNELVKLTMLWTTGPWCFVLLSLCMYTFLKCRMSLTVISILFYFHFLLEEPRDSKVEFFNRMTTSYETNRTQWRERSEDGTYWRNMLPYLPKISEPGCSKLTTPSFNVSNVYIWLTPIFFVEKMREAFALQKLLSFFQQKYQCIGY